MQALKDREEAVRNGKLTTIVFIRDLNSRGQEVSGYIDYGHRLQVENMELVFDRKKQFMPKPSDLSFHNWDTQVSTSNPTPNFQVIYQAILVKDWLCLQISDSDHWFQAIADNEKGLLFKNKRDRKIINVDPKQKPGDNSTRTEITTDEFVQVVIYDHVTRRRS